MHASILTWISEKGPGDTGHRIWLFTYATMKDKPNLAMWDWWETVFASGNKERKGENKKPITISYIQSNRESPMATWHLIPLWLGSLGDLKLLIESCLQSEYCGKWIVRKKNRQVLFQMPCSVNGYPKCDSHSSQQVIERTEAQFLLHDNASEVLVYFL